MTPGKLFEENYLGGINAEALIDVGVHRAAHMLLLAFSPRAVCEHSKSNSGNDDLYCEWIWEIQQGNGF